MDRGDGAILYLCRNLIRQQKLTAQSSNYGQKSGAKTNSSIIFEFAPRQSEQLQDEVKAHSSELQDLVNLGHSSVTASREPSDFPPRSLELGT